MSKVRRVAVRGIIFKDGKLFAQVLKKKEGKEDFWCTPGGGLGNGESITDGLHREMIEETGVAPKIGRLLMVQQFTHNNAEQMEFFFHIENAEDYEGIDISTTSHGNIEIHDFGFIDPHEENILPKDLQTLDIQGLIDSIKPPVIINEL